MRCSRTRLASTVRQVILPSLLGVLFSTSAACAEDCDQFVIENRCVESPEAQSGACRCSSWKDPLTESGIEFTANLTQFYFGTVSGGLEQTDRYGGHGDYLINIDLGKLGLHEGLFVKLRAEHRFGRSIGEPSGVFLPPNLATELPLADSEQVYLTNVLLTQFLSERFAIYAGKLDTLDGEANTYASGRGITQFLNTALRKRSEITPRFHGSIT